MPAASHPRRLGDWAKLAQPAAGALLLVAAVLVGARGEEFWPAPLAAACATLGLAALAQAVTSFRAALLAALPIGLMVGLLAASADATARLWQAPQAWGDLVRLTSLGAAVGMLLLLAAATASLVQRRRLPPIPNALAILALPYLFGGFFLLASSHLAIEVGRVAGLGLASDPALALVLGRAVILLVLNEILIVGLGWLMDRRWSRDARLHAVLLASAALAALSPSIANLGTTAAVAELPWLIRTAAAATAAAAALAAMLAHPERFAGRRVGVVVSGGNVDMRLLSSVILRGLAREGRLARLRVSIADQPGFLAKVASLIGEADGNIVEVHHGRAFSRLSAKAAELEVIVETRGPGHVRAIVNRLMAMGYAVTLLEAPGESRAV